MLKKGDKRFLVILFLLALLVRVGVFYGYLRHDTNYWQVDSEAYHNVAVSIAQGDGIVNQDGSEHFYRLPGYPIFIAFFYKLFCIEPQCVVWMQVFLASMIPLLIFLLSLTLFPTKRLLARCAGLAGVVHLGLVLYSGFFMTEILFIVFLLAFCIFFFRSVHLWFCPAQDLQDHAYKNGRLPWFFCVPDEIAAPAAQSLMFRYDDATARNHIKTWGHGDQMFKDMVMAGLFLGMASLVRPVGHYMLVLVLLLIVASNSTVWNKVRKSTIFFLAWTIPVIPWLVRNFLLTGYLFFTTLPGGHFLYFSAARVAAVVNDCSYQQGRDIVGKEVKQAIEAQQRIIGHHLSAIERCCQHERIARSYFINYPVIAIRMWLLDIFRTCFSLYSAELLYLDSGRQSIDYFAPGRTVQSLIMRYLYPPTDNFLLRYIVYGEILVFLFFIGGFCVGLVNMIIRKKDRERCVWLKLIPLMMLFIVIGLAGGYARMRLPIEPFLIILSLAGWLSVVKVRKYESVCNSI